jgi:hypothetical protein
MRFAVFLNYGYRFVSVNSIGNRDFCQSLKRDGNIAPGVEHRSASLKSFGIVQPKGSSGQGHFWPRPKGSC